MAPFPNLNTLTHLPTRKNLLAEIQKRVEAVQSMQQRSPPGASISSAQLFDYFCKTGLDFPGQANVAIERIGYSVNANVGMRVTPLVSFGRVSATVGGEAARQPVRLFMALVQHVCGVTVGPEQSKPICLMVMGGHQSSSQVRVKVHGSVGFNMEPSLPALEAALFNLKLEVAGDGGGNLASTYLEVFADPSKPQYFARGSHDAMSRAFRDLVSSSPEPLPAEVEGKGKLFLSLRVQSNVATLETSAAIGASVSSPVVNASAEVNAGGPRVTYAYSTRIYRLQTRASNGQFMTQDSEILLKQADTKILKLDAEVEARLNKSPIAGIPASRIPPAKHDFNGRSYGAASVKSLSYRSAVWFWKEMTAGVHDNLCGSGIVYGQSVTTDLLLRLYGDEASRTACDPAIEALAAALCVKTPRLKEYLNDVRQLITDWAPEERPTVFLIEAAFSVLGGGLFHKKGEPPVFMQNFENNRQGELASFRLRLRIKDCVAKDEQWFRLGFDVKAAKLDIKAETIEHFDSEAMVDLNVKEFPGTRTMIPPPILFLVSD